MLKKLVLPTAIVVLVIGCLVAIGQLVNDHPYALLIVALAWAIWTATIFRRRENLNIERDEEIENKLGKEVRLHKELAWSVRLILLVLGFVVNYVWPVGVAPAIAFIFFLTGVFWMPNVMRQALYKWDLSKGRSTDWYLEFQQEKSQRAADRVERESIETMPGHDFEKYVGKRLKKKGYRNIKITPKSGDFGADIIATDKNGDRVCFQCKRYSSPVGIRAVQEISSARTYYGCKKAAVVTNSSYTKAAADLASAENVALFDIAYFE